MGYTHYFSRSLTASNNAEAYNKFRNGVEQLIAQATREGIEIADEQAHETFSFDAVCPEQKAYNTQSPMYFDFCKTAEKPYDVVVTASLLLLKDCYGDAVDISSDGYWSEWLNGRELYKRVFGNDPKSPFVVELEAAV
jgi:hypothetical protein